MLWQRQSTNKSLNSNPKMTMLKKSFKKLFEKAVKDEFGVDTKTIHKKLGNSSDFEAKITAYFDLKTPQDFEDFLAVFCSENSLNYFKNHRKK